MHITDIMDVGELHRLMAEHYIAQRESPCGKYILYNYTERATYDRVWTKETTQCRGLVTTQDGTIVARPFDKFFNVGELGVTVEDLIARPGAVEITDKLDGSMIALWYADGTWHTSTRGSFTSTQAGAALAWLGDLPSYWNSMLRDFTLLCEWCAPDNRVVLKYDLSMLVLIGARHNATGTDLHYQDLKNLGELTTLLVTPRQVDDLNALVVRRSLDIGLEGWVARWPDGFRVKVKTEDYLRLHRLVTGFSASRVRDVLLAAGDAWSSYLADLPEEFRTEAERMADVMRDATEERVQGLCGRYAALAPLAKESRKAYALAVLQEPALDRPFLFNLIDGKPIEHAVLSALDLTALGFEVVNA